MQIVIDIPESIYDTIQADEMISREQLAVLQMHILNATPLSVLLADIRGELWMEGMNMGGEYQGVWVRYGDIERVIDKHISGGNNDG